MKVVERVERVAPPRRTRLAIAGVRFHPVRRAGDGGNVFLADMGIKQRGSDHDDLMIFESA